METFINTEWNEKRNCSGSELKKWMEFLEKYKSRQ